LSTVAVAIGRSGSGHGGVCVPSTGILSVIFTEGSAVCPVDSGSLAVALVPGLLLVWTAYRYVTNRNQAFTRLAESRATEPRVWMLLNASVGRGEPPKVPQTKADELNARMPVAMGLGVWGLVVTGVGIAGVAHLVA